MSPDAAAAAGHSARRQKVVDVEEIEATDSPAMIEIAKVAKGGVTLSKGTWVGAGSTVGGIVLAAIGWANSMKSDLATAIAKLDLVAGQMTRLENRLEKFEDRLLTVERRHSGKRDNNDE